MTTKEIADKLAAYCEKGDFEGAQKEFYSDDVVSIEPEEMEGYDKETKGKEAMKKKMEKFTSSVEESYGNKVHDVIVAGNSFAFVLEMDIKMKGQDRMTMSEICVYTVKGDKVIKEEFFW